MRELLPTSTPKDKELTSIEEKPVTREEFDNLLKALNNLKAQQDIYDEDLESFISDLKQSFETGTLTVNTLQTIEGIIDGLVSNNITTEEFKSTVAEIKQLTSEEIVTHKLNFNEATGGNITVDGDVNANNIVVEDTVEANTVKANEVVAEEFSIDQFNIKKESVDESKIKKAKIDSIDTEHVGATEVIADYVSTDSFDANTVETVDSYSEHIFNKYLTHNSKAFNRQVIDNKATGADGDYWIVLPKFVNGHYYLIVKNGENGPFLWCMEITNDTKNLSFTWSVNSGNQYLQDIDIVEDDELQFIQIHAKEFGKASHLWFQCTSFETTKEPVIYGTKQFDGQKQFKFNTAAGRWLPNSTFIEELHAESMLIDDVEFETVTITRNLQLPSSYDQYGNPEGFTRGETNQYIRDVENEQGARGLQWTTPSEYPDEEDETLITSRGVANYDGKTEQENYPIKHLNEDTTVHGDLTVEDTTTTDNLNVDTKATLPHIVGLNGTSDLNIQEGFLADDTGLWYKTTESVDGVVTAVKYPIAHLDRNVDWSKVSIGSVLGFDKQTKSITPIKSISLDTVNVAEELIVEGLTFLHDDVSIGASLTIRGDLIVDGTTYTTEEESLDTSSDFVVLRKNNKSGLALNEKSGIVVHNYASGKSASIGVDKDGIWRVADNAEEHTTTFNNISQFNGDWYEGIEEDNSITIPHGAITSQDADELSEVVWYNNKYYKWDTVHWFEVSLVDSTLYIDIDAPITDEDLITELEKLDQYDLFYYRSMAVLSISDEFNEPLLTRDEEENLNPHAVLIWDEDKQRAISITTPQTNNTVLTAQITAAQTETTDGYLIGDVAYNSDLTETTIPDGYSEDSRTLIGQIIIFNDLFYTAVTTPAENPEDPDVITYYEVRGLSETGFTDTEEVIVQRLIDELSELDENDVYYVNYSKTTPGSIDYAWKSGGSGSVARFSTYAEYEEALSIPEGQDGYIANNALVVIDEETDYVKVVL